MKLLAKCALALLMLASVLPVGCTKPEDKLVGHYNGKSFIPDSTKRAIGKTHPEQVPLLNAMEAGSYTLDLRQDKSFSSTMSVMGHEEDAAGTWTLDGKLLTLHNAAMPNSTNPTTLTASDDGKTLTNLNNVDHASTITFTRS